MSLLRAATLIAVITLVSKFFGLIRQQVMAYYYGLSSITDAFNYAYNLPGFALVILGGLNGPFHSSIVTVLSRYREKGDEQDAKIILQTTAISVALIMGLLTGLGMWGAPWIVQMLFPGLSSLTESLTIIQLRIMFPLFFISGLLGISYGVLNVRQHYVLPSISPAIASLSLIFAMIIFHRPDDPVHNAYVLAWGTLVGGMLQLGLQLIPLIPAWRPELPQLDFKHPGFLMVGAMLLPSLLSATIGEVNVLIVAFFSSHLPEGQFAAFNNANTVLQLPLGILLTAILVPLLPLMSGAVGESGPDGLKPHLNDGLRSVFLVSFPAMALIFALGQPAIAALFQGGAFDAEATWLVYTILAVMTLSAFAYAVRDLLIRAFYALGNAKIAFYSSLFNLALNSTLIFFLVDRYEIYGVAIAYALVNISQMCLLLYLLRREIGGWIAPESWAGLRSALIASFFLFLGAWSCQTFIGELHLHRLALIGVLVLILPALCVCYGMMLHWLGVPEVQRVTAALKRRLGR